MSLRNNNVIVEIVTKQQLYVYYVYFVSRLVTLLKIVSQFYFSTLSVIKEVSVSIVE